MIINRPPKPKSEPNLKFYIIDKCVTDLEELLHTNFQHHSPYRIEERYFSQFMWFKDLLPARKTILNVGSSWGRETFALMWVLEANIVIGIVLQAKLNEHEMAGINGNKRAKKEAQVGL